MGNESKRKLSSSQRDAIRRRLVHGERGSALAAEYGVSRELVFKLCRGLPRLVRMTGRPFKFSADQESEIARRLQAGEPTRVLAKEFGADRHTLMSLRRRLRIVPSQRKALKRSELRLSYREREEISRGIRARESAREIARRMRRSPSTISREIKRSGGRDAYRAWIGEDLFLERSRRPKEAKLAANDRLRAKVQEGLANFWSPEQISAQLRVEHPEDRAMNVSHETIYQSLYVQGRGALRAELKKYLRTRRKSRKARGPEAVDRGRIKDMVSISERPPEANDRAVPGHWEGDLLIGRRGKSAIATLVERRSRYVMLIALPDGRTAEYVKDALARKIKTLPTELRRTLTWDQGKEMAHHISFTIDTGVRVFFCDPHSPWQRGSNENTNGLLRQFLPKTADLSTKTQAELDRIAALMNGRPRQTLNWAKPCEYLYRAVAMTA
jgi:transposase, IS30 family